MFLESRKDSGWLRTIFEKSLMVGETPPTPTHTHTPIAKVFIFSISFLTGFLKPWNLQWCGKNPFSFINWIHWLKIGRGFVITLVGIFILFCGEIILIHLNLRYPQILTYACKANWCLSNFSSMQAFFSLPLKCAWSIQTFSTSTVIHITIVDFTILSTQMVFLAPGLGWCKLERCTFKRSNLFSTNVLIYGLRSVSFFCTSWSLESSSFAYWIWLNTGLIEHQKNSSNC